MSEFEDRVNSILSDPAQMEKITNLAKSLMGGQTGGQDQEPAQEQGGLASILGSDGIDAAALGRIGRLIKAGNREDSKQRALLEAMRPYLSQKRRDKMDRALRIAKVAKIAELAIGGLGDDGDV